MDGETTVGGKRSMWMAHVKKTMKAHKGMKLKDVLKVAKKTYKKSKKGGVDEGEMMGGALSPLPLSGGSAPLTPAPVGGRRRRGSRKSRGTRKH